MIERVEEKLKSFKLPEFVENTLIALFALFFSTAIHEFGHFLSAYLVGCPAGIAHVGMITGATGISESCTNVQAVFIALGGPLFAFLVALLIWFFEKESKLKYLSVILFLLSSSIQLIPLKPTDGYMAIHYGLNPVVELFIFLLVYSVSANIIISALKRI